MKETMGEDWSRSVVLVNLRDFLNPTPNQSRLNLAALRHSVMSIILCQQKKRGSCSLFEIFVSKDGKQNPFHTGSVTEGSHRSSPPSDLSESAFNRISCP